MRIGLIRIAAAMLLTVSLLGGCGQKLDLAQDGEEIRFSATPLELRAETTKSTTDAFVEDKEKFVVYGERVTSSDVRTTVFDGVSVSHSYEEDIVDDWDYTNHQAWQWGSVTDRYDFVAVFPAIPPGDVNVRTEKLGGAGNISLSTHYDYLTGAPTGGDKFDLLAASYRRNGNIVGRNDIVDLTFTHMGSAVSVAVLNNSKESDITVTSIYYQNLVVSGDAIVTIDAQGRPYLYWANTTPNASAVRKLTKEPDPLTTISPREEYTGEYQIMIPQNLEMYGASLYLKYIIGNGVEQTSPAIPLASILNESDEPITSWEIGYKYTYTISVRADGGLLVIVRTTPWDVPVVAETPGILID